jgi:hypothetical protein
VTLLTNDHLPSQCDVNSARKKTLNTQQTFEKRQGADHLKNATSQLLRLVVTLCVVLSLSAFISAKDALALEVIVGLPYGNHHIGHTAVRVTTPDGDEVVYDFGRYGKVWGPLKMQGEGMMRVWRGAKAVRRYLRKQQGFRSSKGYVIDLTPEEEARAYQYYEDLLATAKWSKDYPLHKRYRLERDYDGVLTQCTSIALEGIKHVWPRETWERLLDPKFNVGQGFKKKVRRYYFKTQRAQKRLETVVPLDVIDSFNAELKRTPSLITEVRRYPQR